MTQEEMNRVALVVAARIIKQNLKAPNSGASKKLSEWVEAESGISRLEIHRFNNAIVNNNVHNSFKEGRAYEIAWSFLKTDIRYQRQLPNDKSKKLLLKMAREEQMPEDWLLDTYRQLFKEVIDETLSTRQK